MSEAWQPVDASDDPFAFEWRGDPSTMVDGLEDLLEWLRPPAWHAEAGCRGMGPKRWYPERGDSRFLAQARALCADCPVRTECAAAGDAHGLWGGLSVRQRQRLRKLANAQTAA